MSNIALVVRIRPKAGHREAFLARLREHAVNCRSNEEGCLRFEMLMPKDGADDRVFLVEVYADDAALEVHRNSEHFKSYRRDTDRMIAEREIVECAGEAAQARCA